MTLNALLQNAIVRKYRLELDTSEREMLVGLYYGTVQLTDQ